MDKIVPFKGVLTNQIKELPMDKMAQIDQVKAVQVGRINLD